MRIALKVLATLAAVFYPLLVLWVLYCHREYLPAVCLAGIAVLGCIAIRRRNGNKWRLATTIGALLVLGVVRLSDNPEYLKLYPILVSGVLLFEFAWSLRHPPCIVERFARLAQRGQELPEHACKYCRNVTRVWIGFFCVNITLSVLSSLSGSWELWALYNGCISYILIGLLMGGEWLVRRRVQARTPR